MSTWGRVGVVAPMVVVIALAATGHAQEPGGAQGPLEDIGIGKLVAMITAIGALGAAAFSLVDASKAFGGGISNVGYFHLCSVVERFSAALDHALGAGEWRAVLRAHWLNGRPRGEQKAILKSLIRLGIAPSTVAALARYGHVTEAALSEVARRLESGAALSDADRNVLGRLDAAVEAQLDAAFDCADQRYRNVAQLCAGIVAVALAFVAGGALGWRDRDLALIVGLLAVPFAPVAKDLASSLQAAAQALRASR